MACWRWHAVLLVAACGDVVAIESNDTDMFPTTGSATRAPMTTTPPMMTSTTGGATSPGTTTPPMMTTAVDGSSSSSTSGFDTGFTSTSTGLMPGAIGDPCIEDSECTMGNCYTLGLLGGICSECDEDADCPDGGCTPPALFEPDPGVCNLGQLGGGCETLDACQAGLVCAEVFDVPGALTVMSCSECETDLDCGGQLCSPTYELSGPGSVKTCVDAGSVLDGDGCDLASSGDSACASGHCGPVDFSGVTELGFCGECTDATDCAVGMTCDAGIVVMGVVFPSQCV